MRQTKKNGKLLLLLLLFLSFKNQGQVVHPKTDSVSISTKQDGFIANSVNLDSLKLLRGNTALSNTDSVKKEPGVGVNPYLKAPELSHLPKPLFVSTSKDSLGLKKDSTFKNNFKKKLPHFKLNTSGNISFGFDYGLIPFIQNFNVPSSYFNSLGLVNVSLFSIPISVSYRYTSLKNISGLNNYFRVSFDANTYKQQLLSQVTNKKNLFNSSIDSLEKQKLNLNNKITYYQYLSSQTNTFYTDLSNSYGKVPGMPDVPRMDKITSNDSLYKIFTDSLNGVKNGLSKQDTGLVTGMDSSGRAKKYIRGLQRLDSIILMCNKLYDLKQNYNLSSLDTSALNSKCTSLQKQMTDQQRKIDDLKNQSKLLNDSLVSPNSLSKSLPLSSFKKLLLNTKKFEIGLCYPNYSNFLISGITLRGVNMEYEKSSFFFAFSAGKTINNIYLTNNLIDNTILKNRNVLNYFDFNKVDNGRSLASVKLGYGKLNSTHLHIGFLYGVGKSSMFTNTVTDVTTVSKDQNYVVEVDGRMNIKKSYVQAAYGKSSLQSNAIVFNEFSQGFKGILNNSRSNAVLVKTYIPISAIHNNVSFTFRLIDPFFKSYGVGFMRSDNIRYEIKSDQYLFKSKLKLGAYYRQEEDNILNFLSYKNIIKSAGFSSTVRVKRNLSVRVDYSPLVQIIKTPDQKIERHNSITNVVFSLLPGNNKLQSSVNLMGSFYKLTNDGVANNFYTTNLTVSTALSKIFQNNIYGGWFFVNGRDSLQTGTGNSYILNEEVVIKASDRIKFSGNVKIANSQSVGFQSGYGIKFNAKITKHISWDVNAEKVVIGDFYNAYPIALINKFPYYCSTKINLSW